MATELLHAGIPPNTLLAACPCPIRHPDKQDFSDLLLLRGTTPNDIWWTFAMALWLYGRCAAVLPEPL